MSMSSQNLLLASKVGRDWQNQDEIDEKIRDEMRGMTEEFEDEIRDCVRDYTIRDFRG